MSSILGMAQTAQGLANAAAMAAAGTAASGAASAASSGVGALGSLGSGVIGSLGSAASLGPLAVPASWTSVIPAAHERRFGFAGTSASPAPIRRPASWARCRAWPPRRARTSGPGTGSSRP